jgi:hypothetical protein
MTLGEASVRFIADFRKCQADDLNLSSVEKDALALLIEYFSADKTITDISPAALRDFLARRYVEKASMPRLSNIEASQTSQESYALKVAPGTIPKPSELLLSLSRLFEWMDQQTGSDLAQRFALVLDELSRSLPRAVEITQLLSTWLQERGGAFGFPEFLTSFEEGGRSEYDIDTPGSPGAIDGYFRILRVEGTSVEAEELISEERVWPVVFPPNVAALLQKDYLINLELVRGPAGWVIAGCGFAYPPGTDL